MKILNKIDLANWENDPDKGEMLIGEGLIKNKDLISKDYTYVHIALCPLINDRGIPYTQNIIDEITNKQNKRFIFVCQHVYIGYINFYNNLVFSTHSEIDSDIFPIPHYSAVYNKELIKEERDVLFSFIGHCGTHEIREELLQKYPDKCFSTEGVWMSEKYRDKYVELLGKSKFSLTPRGTGCSSLRIYESLKMGSIPVIISDNLRLPVFNGTSWSCFSVKIKENEIDSIEKRLSIYNDDEIKKMSEMGQQIWDEYCSDENLYKTIIEQLFDKKY